VRLDLCHERHQVNYCNPRTYVYRTTKLIKHYGAQLVTTDKELDTKGAIDKACSLVAHTPNAVMLDQFANQANPDMHFNTTAQEIWRDTAGKVDILIAGVGTGGNITGIAKALKIPNPNIQIIAVEPASCPVLSKCLKVFIRYKA
jgi:cysteine synthase A